MSSKSTGQVEITYEFKRHVGPRYIHGSVKIIFDALRPYSFASNVIWPESENYEGAVRKAVEEVLIEKNGSLDTVQVVLKEVHLDPESSCEIGFYRAARLATLSAFESFP